LRNAEKKKGGRQKLEEVGQNGAPDWKTEKTGAKRGGSLSLWANFAQGGERFTKGFSGPKIGGGGLGLGEGT